MVSPAEGSQLTIAREDLVAADRCVADRCNEIPVSTKRALGRRGLVRHGGAALESQGHDWINLEQNDLQRPPPCDRQYPASPGGRSAGDLSAELSPPRRRLPTPRLASSALSVSAVQPISSAHLRRRWGRRLSRTSAACCFRVDLLPPRSASTSPSCSNQVCVNGWSSGHRALSSISRPAAAVVRLAEPTSATSSSTTSSICRSAGLRSPIPMVSATSTRPNGGMAPLVAPTPRKCLVTIRT